jgi:hypothetical protein
MKPILYLVAAATLIGGSYLMLSQDSTPFTEEMPVAKEAGLEQLMALTCNSPTGYMEYSTTGTDNDTDSDANFSTVAYNPKEDQYFIVWQGDPTPGVDALDYFGQIVNSDGTEAGGDKLVGPGATISMEASANVYADIAYNSKNNEYFVVYEGEYFVNNEVQVAGQRIDKDGNKIGGANSEVQITSSTSPWEVDPAVAYNTRNNEYLVVYRKQDSQSRVHGKFVNGDGTLSSIPEFPISPARANSSIDAGSPDIVYNGLEDEYLLIWREDFPTDGDEEIFVQRLQPNGTLIGSPVQASNLGVTGTDIETLPKVSLDPVNNRYLVLWRENDGSMTATQQNEVFGQFLNADATLLGFTFQATNFVPGGGGAADDATVSKFGVDFNFADQEFILVSDPDGVPSGSVDSEQDIYLQTIAYGTPPIISSPVRITQVGTPDGNSRTDGSRPSVAYNPSLAQAFISAEADVFQQVAPPGTENEIIGACWTPPNPTPAAPEIVVESPGGTDIPDNDTSPNTGDGTDFGSVDVASGSQTNTFVLKNTGTNILNLTGSPVVNITGMHSGDFTVVAQPADLLMPGDVIEFSITFDPSAAGLREATVSIANNDSNENPFNFDIQGTGAAACTANAGTLSGTTESICVGGTSTVFVSGNNTDAAYTQVFLIADAALNVTSIQSSTTLTFATPGTYTVYSYNYETGSTAPSNPATIGAIDCNANCCDLLASAFTITVLRAVNILNAVNPSSAPEDPSSSSPLTFLISRGMNASGEPALTVNFTISGTATLGTDYTLSNVNSSTSATIAANTQSIAVQATPINDTDFEPDETIIMTLQPGTGYCVGTESTGTRTILDDDSQEVEFSVTPAPSPEGNSGTTNFNYTITRTGPALTSLEIQWTASGTGTNPADGADFVGGTPIQTGNVIFGLNETEKTFSVQIAGDTDLENDETFQVSLSNPTSVPGVTFGTNNPTVSTILNDDQEVAIAATDADKAEGNAGTTPFTFTVSRTGFINNTLYVDYDVTGTGVNPANAADFGGTLANGTVSLAPNESSKVLTIDVSGDMTVEPDESFRVTLSNPNPNGSSGVELTTPSADGTIQNDDAALISITDVSQPEGDAGPSLFAFDISVDKAVQGGFMVDYETAIGPVGPATPGTDYSAIPTTIVNFAGNANETQTINVTVNGDTDFESDETFVVDLSNIQAGGLNVSFADDQGLGTILDDDTPEIAVTGNSVFIPNGSTGTSGLDGTFFGFFQPTTPPLSKTFVIKNNGPLGSDLAITSITASNSPCFTILPPVPTMVSGGDAAPFQVQFDPAGITTPGEFTATITVNTNDPNNPTYTFQVLARVFVPGFVPTMGQWAFFLFGLSLFTLMVVGLWNVKRSTVNGKR